MGSARRAASSPEGEGEHHADEQGTSRPPHAAIEAPVDVAAEGELAVAASGSSPEGGPPPAAS